MRHVAGLVFSAFSRAAFWGLVTANPVKFSEPPGPKRHRAINAEAARRIEERKKAEVRKRGAPRVAASLPTTLTMLLAEFIKQHAQEKLAPKTVERYTEMAEYNP